MSTATSGRAREHRVRAYVASDPADRFWSKVTGESIDECWMWTASRTPAGYGKFFLRKEAGKPILTEAHRWAYEHLRAEIPDGLHIDHLCRNRACVNPWHLEPVTPAENTRRGVSGNGSKTHCKRGHAFDDENTLRTPKGFRRCRACTRLHDAARRGAAA